MPYRAESGVSLLQRSGYAGVVRLIEVADPVLQLGDGKLARVHGHSAMGEPPHESDAKLGLARRRDRPGPWIGEQLGIDIRAVTVGIDVRTRKMRFDQRRTDRGRVGVQRFDMCVL